MKPAGTYIEIPIENIKPNPWNPNKQTDFIFEKEITSIEKNGFIDPITVREKGKFFEIIDGEHRWKGASKLGYRFVSAINLGRIEDSDAQQLTWIMNETRGSADPDLLSKLLQQIRSQVPLAEIIKNIPRPESEIHSMLAHSEVDWNAINPSLGGDNQKPEKETKSIQTFTVELSSRVFKAFDKALVKIESELVVERGEAIKWLADLIMSHDIKDLSEKKIIRRQATSK